MTPRHSQQQHMDNLFDNDVSAEMLIFLEREESALEIANFLKVVSWIREANCLIPASKGPDFKKGSKIDRV